MTKEESRFIGSMSFLSESNQHFLYFFLLPQGHGAFLSIIFSHHFHYFSLVHLSIDTIERPHPRESF